MRHRHGMAHLQQLPSGTFPLALASEGEIVRVIMFPQVSRIQERLLSMGISINDEIIIIQKQPGGALLIEKNGTRYVMGGGMALKIQVVKSLAKEAGDK